MKKIFFLAITVFIVLAIIKNPTKNESRERVRAEVVELFNNKVRGTLLNEEQTNEQQFKAVLTGLLAPALIDGLVNVEVNDYIVFSSYNATITLDGSETKLVSSGIIVFGKIIPL